MKTCPNDCSHNGVCKCGVCECDRAYIGPDCSTTCPTNCSGNGVCLGAVCHCDDGWAGPSCSVESGCPNDCNAKGNCSEGFCECEAGWSGDDCSFPGEDEHTRLPSCDSELLNNCSGHGLCIFSSLTNIPQCQCEEGFFGTDCSATSNDTMAIAFGCLSTKARQCVTSWLRSGCPTANFVPSMECREFDHCRREAQLSGKCPFTPSLVPNSNITTPAHYNWTSSNSTTTNTSGTPWARLVHQAQHVPFPPPLDCSDSHAQGCVALFVKAGCPVQDYVPLKECRKWRRCHFQAFRDGKCG